MKRNRHSPSNNALTGRREYAMYNENEVRLVGNLGRDPQVFDNGAGQRVAQLNLATSRRWKDSDGEWQSATDWVPVTAFGQLAEVAAEQLSKGSYALIRGRIRTQRLEQEGTTVFKTDVVASRIAPLERTKPAT